MPQLSPTESLSSSTGRLVANQFTVGAVLQLASQALAGAFPTDCWISGEVADYQAHKSGHHYFKLVEPVPGGRPKALDCAIWSSTIEYVQRDLVAVGITIANGQKMMFRGQVKLYDGGGKLTFHIREVSPEFTLGDIEARRRTTVERLKRERLIEKNKSQVLPELPLRICLLSSRNAEGRADFLEVIAKSGYAFDIHVEEIPVQGTLMAPHVCSTLKMLAAKQSLLNFDAVCIVRGGGSSTDLDWWNNYEICAAIARMPMPVITGIGHHRDQVAVQEVAHTSAGTPTAAAQFFCNKVQDQDERLQEIRSNICRFAEIAVSKEAHAIAGHCSMIATRATSAVDLQKSELTSLRNQVTTLSTGVAEHEKTKAHGLLKQFLSQVASLVRSEKTTLSQRRQSLKNARGATMRASGQVAKLRELLDAEGRRLLQSQNASLVRYSADTAHAATRVIDAEARALSLLVRAIRREPPKLCAAESRHLAQQEKLVTAYDPINNLRRGYSITRDSDGQIVRSVDAAAAGAEITTQVANGFVRSVVVTATVPEGES